MKKQILLLALIGLSSAHIARGDIARFIHVMIQIENMLDGTIPLDIDELESKLKLLKSTTTSPNRIERINEAYRRFNALQQDRTRLPIASPAPARQEQPIGETPKRQQGRVARAKAPEKGTAITAEQPMVAVFQQKEKGAAEPQRIPIVPLNKAANPIRVEIPGQQLPRTKPTHVPANQEQQRDLKHSAAAKTQDEIPMNDEERGAHKTIKKAYNLLAKKDVSRALDLVDSLETKVEQGRIKNNAIIKDIAKLSQAIDKAMHEDPVMKKQLERLEQGWDYNFEQAASESEKNQSE